MKGIIKRFSRIVANNKVDFDLRVGEIHALLGENGAGKTTLMKILSGLYQPDEGKILIKGQTVRFRSPKDAMDMSIGMVHQHFELVPKLTVVENIMLGACKAVFIDIPEKEKEIQGLSEKYGLDVNPKSRIYQLSVGEQQRVEILKMLYRKVKILILDEPTSSLTANEVEKLFSTLRKLTKEGCSIIFITHKLEEVLEIADYITVLRRGKVAAAVNVKRIKQMNGLATSELAKMMVGREVILSVDKNEISTGKEILGIENLHVQGDRREESVRGISFSLNMGEIFGILGVAGNGQKEMVEAIVGLRSIKDGEIRRKGSMNYVPEDRINRAAVPGMSIADNLILTSYKDFSKPIFHKGLVRNHGRKLIKKYDIKPPFLSIPVKQLSGGNLQRLILARELSQKPNLLIAEQPTAGLDISSTEQVWKFLISQRENGAVLLVSGNLKEVLSISDRIAVIFRGSLMDIISVKNQPEKIEKIELMMAGFV